MEIGCQTNHYHRQIGQYQSYWKVGMGTSATDHVTYHVIFSWWKRGLGLPVHLFFDQIYRQDVEQGQDKHISIANVSTKLLGQRGGRFHVTSYMVQTVE